MEISPTAKKAAKFILRANGEKEPSFSERERQILVLMADGLDSQSIAERLHVSVFTVQTHRRNMQKRHGCRNSISLVSYALRNGVIV